MAWTPEQAAAYAAANPDVWKSYQSDPQNQGMTLQQAMEGHYNNFGQGEGRAAPTVSQGYSQQNLSPYLSAGIQNSTKAYDVNGNMVNLGAGQRLTGGSLNGNVIYNADGTSAGNYYTSPADSARARAQIQASIASGAVAGPQRQAAPSWANAQQVNSPYAQTYKRQISGNANQAGWLGGIVDIGNGIKQWQGNTGSPGQSSVNWDPSVLYKQTQMGSSISGSPFTSLVNPYGGGMATNPYGSQSGGMWGGRQQNTGGYGYGNLGFGGYGQQQNYGGMIGQQQGGYSAYGGAQNPYGQVAYRRGLLG